VAITYGTLYLLFGAYPIVFRKQRGWNQGVAGLPFLAIIVGIVLALIAVIPDNQRYKKILAKRNGKVSPEDRLPLVILGSFFLPIGLLWFAFTSEPSFHWLLNVAAGVPFGFGMVLISRGLSNYLVDSYTVWSASVLATMAILRSLFGAVFPLFTAALYAKLGTKWATCVPGFLSLACLPFPIIAYIYGESLRKRCYYAKQAAKKLEKLEDSDSEK